MKNYKLLEKFWDILARVQHCKHSLIVFLRQRPFCIQHTTSSIACCKAVPTYCVNTGKKKDDTHTKTTTSGCKIVWFNESSFEPHNKFFQNGEENVDVGIEDRTREQQVQHAEPITIKEMESGG